MTYKLNVYRCHVPYQIFLQLNRRHYINNKINQINLLYRLSTTVVETNYNLFGAKFSLILQNETATLCNISYRCNNIFQLCSDYHGKSSALYFLFSL